MMATPEIVQTRAQAAAVIHIAVPRSDMMKVFGPAVRELMTALADQGVEPLGAIFAHHLKMSSHDFDFEVGVKVAQPVKVAGRVRPGELPAAKVACTVYSGPYEGLPSAWDEFRKWIRANGHEPAHTLWESYAIGPQSTPDPAGWRTELFQPLRA